MSLLSRIAKIGKKIDTWNADKKVCADAEYALTALYTPDMPRLDSVVKRGNIPRFMPLTSEKKTESSASTGICRQTTSIQLP